MPQNFTVSSSFPLRSQKITVIVSSFDFHFVANFKMQIFNGLIRLEDEMRVLTSRSPSPTATISHCPQCGAVMHIKLIEPDLKEASRARHVFECEECSLPRTYFFSDAA